MTLDRNSWGFRRAAVSADYLTIEELLSVLASTVRYLTKTSQVLNIQSTNHGN